MAERPRGLWGMFLLNFLADDTRSHVSSRKTHVIVQYHFNWLGMLLADSHIRNYFTGKFMKVGDLQFHTFRTRCFLSSGEKHVRTTNPERCHPVILVKNSHLKSAAFTKVISHSKTPIPKKKEVPPRNSHTVTFGIWYSCT